MRIFAKVMPRKLKQKYEENAKYARLRDAERAIGFFIFNGLILALIIGFIFSRFFSLVFSALMFVLMFFFIEVFFYYSLALRADNVSKKIEEVLPDALQLMASNLRAGMITERALLLSGREEFGLLKEEIDRIGREIATGKSIAAALKEMSYRFKSEKLKKAVQLINSGLASGGELSSLLEQIAINMRDQEFVDKKVRSSVLMYVIFIFIAVGFGAPALFALSSYLIEVLATQLAQVELPKATATQLPLTLTTISVTPQFITMYLMLILTTTSILGSLILGLISKGEEKAGVKYIPFLLALSFAIFFIVRSVIKNAFSGILGFS